jgi:hypothetical protein
MDKFVIIRKHWLALAIALVVGLQIVSPTVLSINKIGLSNFRGIYFILNNDEDTYLSRTKDVYDGHWNLGNTLIKDHKQDPSMQQPLAEIIMAGVAKLLHLSVPTLFAVNDFILPIIGLLVLYSLLLQLGIKRNISAVSAGIFYLIFIETFNRPINPQFT